VDVVIRITNPNKRYLQVVALRTTVILSPLALLMIADKIVLSIMDGA
jgi:hypothetical protein